MWLLQCRSSCWYVCIIAINATNAEKAKLITIAGKPTGKLSILNMFVTQEMMQRTARIIPHFLLVFNIFFVFLCFCQCWHWHMIFFIWEMSSYFYFTWNLLKKSYTNVHESNRISQFLVGLEENIHERETILNRRNTEKKETTSSSAIFHIFVIIFGIFSRVYSVF